MTRRAGTLAVSATLVALLAGCGDDERASSTTPPAVQIITAPATQAQARTPTTGPRDAPARGREPRLPDKRVDHLTGFSSPSRNIGCYIDTDNVRCDISQRSWKPPRAPSGCELDYGQGIAMSAGSKPGFVCAGDTALGSRAKLSYGQAIVAGVLRCESRRSGMRCRDTKTGRGFTLSRERYDLR